MQELPLEHLIFNNARACFKLYCFDKLLLYLTFDWLSKYLKFLDVVYLGKHFGLEHVRFWGFSIKDIIRFAFVEQLTLRGWCCCY